MKAIHLVGLTILAIVVGVAPGRELSVTIYNEDLGLVTDKRTMDFPMGVDTVWISDVPQLINPSSVRFSASHAMLVEQQYDSNWSKPWLPSLYTGRDVLVETKDGSRISGRYVHTNWFSTYYGTISVVEKDSTLTVVPAESVTRFTFPAISTADTANHRLMWIVESETDRPQDVQFSYLTGGMSWRAEYNLAVSEGTNDADFSGWVTIVNRCGMDMNNASVKLVAGELHRIQKEQRSYDGLTRLDIATKSLESQRQFSERSLFEYHLYEMNMRTSVPDKKSTHMSLIPPVGIKARRAYEFNPERSVDRIGVTLEFDNSNELGLGIPLPAGAVRVYQVDTDGSQQFIGEDTIKHTPKDERVSVKVGEAFDIAVDRTQTDYRQVSYHETEARYEVRIRNHKRETVEVKVLEPVWGDWSVLMHSHDYRKISSRQVEFPVTCIPDSQTVVTYTIRFR